MRRPLRLGLLAGAVLLTLVVPVLLGTRAGLLGARAGAAEDSPQAVADDGDTAVAQAITPWSAEDLARRFPDPDAGADAEAFAGTPRCIECHEERRDTLETSFHASLNAEERGCEACHGAGHEHSESDGIEFVRHPWDAPAEEMVGVCIRCHTDVLEKPIRGHRTWTAAEGRDVRACSTCHEIHVDRSLAAHSKETGPFRDIAALNKVAESIPASRCIECHSDYHPEFARSGHADLGAEADPSTDAPLCGACHGNGSLHETSGGRAGLIINPAHQQPLDADRGCNSCHGGGAIVQRWTCSEHAKEGTTCITCHDANAPRGRTLRASEYELCGSCHLDVKASFRLPNGHKVARGRVTCSDCHDPHDNPQRVRSRDVRERSCGKCHGEKVGPFVHDHGIKRTEGCIACHAPHGSVNDRMLTFKRMKPQCLQCHPGSSHDLSQRRYDNCIACHVEIHGSDLDRYFLR
jgi:DmsE family decaheme c-type cytochrome